MIFNNWFPSNRTKASTKDVFSESIEDIKKEVIASGLFDEQWYIAQNVDIEFDNKDPLTHFLEAGYLQNRDPSESFSVSIYLNSYTDVADAKMNPLIHYIRYGKEEGRAIKSSTKSLRAQQQLEMCNLTEREKLIFSQLSMSSDFQAHWYVTCYNELDIDESLALKHYVLFGSKLGLDPSPFFSVEKYRVKYGAKIDNDSEPFLHYHSFGKYNCCIAERSVKSQNIDINRLLQKFKPTARHQFEMKALQEGEWFDSSWYIKCLDEPIDPSLAILHYIVIGVYSGLDPCLVFSTDFYLKENPDVVKLGVNPLWHYQTHGSLEHRQIRTSEKARYIDLEEYLATYNFTQSQKAQISVIENCSLFNGDWYARRYSELNISQSTAHLHYFLYGASEEKDPGPYFSTSFYMECYPDISASALNPLYHFIKFGNTEKRLTLNSKSAVLDIIGHISNSNTHATSTERVLHFDSETQVSEMEQPIILNTCELHSSLFDKLNERAEIDDELLELWEADSLSNIDHLLNDIYISKQNSLKLRFNLPTLCNKNINIQVFQYDFDKKNSVMACRVDLVLTYMNFVVLDLPNIFSPTLISVELEGKTHFSQLLPFPSMLRGGPHFAECFVSSKKLTYLSKYTEYCKILLKEITPNNVVNIPKFIGISMADAIGNEPLFDFAFVTWCWQFFGIKYLGYMPKATDNTEERRQEYFSTFINVTSQKGNTVLVNPIDRNSLPCLRLIINIGLDGMLQGPKTIIPESLTHTLSKVVKLQTVSIGNYKSSVYTMCNDCFTFPSSVVQKNRTIDDSKEIGLPTSFVDNGTEAIKPFSLSLILEVKDGGKSTQKMLFDSLRNQMGIKELNIILAVNERDNIELFLGPDANNLQVVVRENNENYSHFYKRCLANAKQDIVIHLCESVILYDRGTLFKLASMISGSIKNASCKMFTTVKDNKGDKLLPVNNSLQVIRNDDQVELRNILNQPYYPENLVYSIFANLPFIVAYDKTEMEIFLETHNSDDVNTLFIDFGAYLSNQNQGVVVSNEFSVGTALAKDVLEQFVETSEFAQRALHDCKYQTEEHRGFK